MKHIVLFITLILAYITGLSQNIIKAEYFFDADPGTGNATEINFTQTDNELNFNIPVNLSQGFHILGVRVLNDNSLWSMPVYEFFYVKKLETIPSATGNAIVAEYYFDTDPGIGKGTPINLTASNDLLLEIPVENLTPGFHTLFVRVKDQNGKWSFNTQEFFYIEKSAKTGGKIVALEYQFDQDSGVGNGNLITLTPDTAIDVVAPMPVTGLDTGQHTVLVRAKDEYGNWSLTAAGEFNILDCDFPPVPAQPVGPQTVCPDVTSEYTINSVELATSYEWELTPTEAGTIQASDTSATVTWSSSFTGTAYIRARGVNDCSAGNWSESLTVNVTADDNISPTITCVDSQVVYVGANNVYTVSGTQFDPVGYDDNCQVADIVNDYNNSSTLQGAQFTPGSYDITWTVTDASGNSSSCTFHLEVMTGTFVNSLIGQVNLYPNPASGKFILETTLSSGTAELLDLSGRVLMTKSITADRMEFDISRLPSGIYTLRIISKNGVGTLKIIHK